MTSPMRVKNLSLHTTQGEVGSLFRQSQFVVRYNDPALKAPEMAISLTMPPRPQGWSSDRIPPVLAMNLPEGFLRDRVIDRYRKVMDIEDMNLLAVTSTRSSGRVWAAMPDRQDVETGKPIALRDILAHRGTEELFDELLDKYSTVSISGVQPKVVVPEYAESAGTAFEKTSVKSPDLIVKAAGTEYPGLAENEFICMSVARHIGLELPRFWLSDDRKLFVIRRFDMGVNGYLGFEDMAALTGRHPEDKYRGSYADVAKAVEVNVASSNRVPSLEALFRLVVLNCAIRNGDAHLKNFGVLYGDPKSADTDARLAPVYDLVNTTMYLPRDVLALSLGGSKAWPTGKTLERFGRDACGVRKPGEVIEDVSTRVMEYRAADTTSKVWKQVRKQIEIGVTSIQAGTAKHRPLQ